MPEPGAAGPPPTSEVDVQSAPVAPAGNADNALRTRPVARVGVAGGLAMLVVIASWAVAPDAIGPGVAVMVVGFGVAVGLYGLNRPVLAVILLLVTMFLRVPLKYLPGLPAEPRMLVFLGVVAAAVIALVRGTARPPKLGPVEGAMALYLLWNVGSALAPHPYPTGDPATGVPDSEHTLIITGTVIPFTLYLLGRFLFDRESAIRKLLWAAVIFGAYSTFHSIAQFHAPALRWPNVDLPLQSGWFGRAVGVLTQPVINGLIIVIGFAVALHLAHQPRTPQWQRIVIFLSVVPTMYALFLTHTRVVWLVFAITLGIGAVLLPRSRTSFVAIMMTVALVIGLNWSTFTSSDRSAGGVAQSTEVGDRENMIATALWAVQERPIAGWGIGRFTYVNTFHHKQWSIDVPWQRGYSISSHFNELGIAAELGLVGLSLWLAVLVLICRRLLNAVFRLPRDGPFGRGLAVVALIAFIAFIVTGTTVDLRFFDFASALVMLLAGATVSHADRVLARSSGTTDATEHPPTGRFGTEHI